jgi:hypothetical protein
MCCGLDVLRVHTAPWYTVCGADLEVWTLLSSEGVVAMGCMGMRPPLPGEQSQLLTSQRFALEPAQLLVTRCSSCGWQEARFPRFPLTHMRIDAAGWRAVRKDNWKTLRYVSRSNTTRRPASRLTSVKDY